MSSLDIAERIRRGMTLDCYSRFGSMAFCEKCPIAIHCKQAKDDDFRLLSQKENLENIITAPEHDSEIEEPLNLVTVSNEADRAMVAMLMSIFCLTSKELDVLRMRIRFPLASGKELAMRLKCHVDAVYSHFREIEIKMPQLARFIYFSQAGKDHVRRDNLKYKYKRGGRPVLCLDTGEVFSSVKAAAEKHGTHHSLIRKACYSGYRAGGGYRWRFVNREAGKDEAQNTDKD